MTVQQGRPHPLRTLVILLAGALAFAVAQTSLIPTLTALQEELGTDSSGVAWILTGYLLVAAVATPVAGRLGDMLGKRGMFVGSLAVFGLGSVVSALGHSIEIVVAGRLMQGVGGGILPLAIGIIRDELPADRVPGSIGLISATLGIGGGAGLVMGGTIVDHLPYQWIFWSAAIIAAPAAVAARLLVPESPVRTPGRVDLLGAAVLALGLTPLLYAIARANTWGWASGRTVGLLAAGVLLLAAFIALERRTSEPLVDFGALLRPPVLMTNVTTLLVGFGMFGSFMLIPQLAETPRTTGYGLGLDATEAGLVMLPGSLIMLFSGPLSGALGERLGFKVPLAAGALITAAGLLAIALEHSVEATVLAFNATIAVGYGLVLAAIPNLIVSAVPPTQTGEAIGINMLVRSVGGSLGIQVSAAVLAGSVTAASAAPSEGGYSWAFALTAGVAAVAGLVALAIPVARPSRTAATGPAYATAR
jgi:EmrB/QacA subfamily drug resistance transporter